MSWGELLPGMRQSSARRAKSDLREPVTSFTGKELFEGEIVKTLAVILRTTGCHRAATGGCTMCGYPAESADREPTGDELQAQLEHALQDAGGKTFPVVKLYTSGSFLDGSEIPIKVAAELLSSLPGDTEKVVVESRPEFVTASSLEKLLPLIPGLEIGIGLETASDWVRKNCINKGFDFSDYQKAVDIARDVGAGIRTYLLLKPPFMTERAAVDDIVLSLEAVAHLSDHVSLNLTTVQRGTYTEYLWRRRGYRPPWLWSVVDIAQRWMELEKNDDISLTIDPVGAGKTRGPHNCGKCDRYFSRAIRGFSLTQDIHEFDVLRCGCRALYEKNMELEEKAFGGTLVR